MQNEARQRLLQLQQGLQTVWSQQLRINGGGPGRRAREVYWTAATPRLTHWPSVVSWLQKLEEFYHWEELKAEQRWFKKNPEASNDSSQNHSQARKGIRGQLRHKTPLRTWICSDATVPRGKHSVSLEVCSILREIERERHTPTASIFLTSVTISFLELPRQVMHRFSYSSPCVIGIKAA